jgi:hypothetical protein
VARLLASFSALSKDFMRISQSSRGDNERALKISSLIALECASNHEKFPSLLDTSFQKT